MQANHNIRYRLTTPNTVLMVRPSGFRPNEQTAIDNSFQKPGTSSERSKAKVSENASAEFDEMVQTLRKNDIAVEVFNTEGDSTPDAVFPNNWLSTHHNGLLVTYPMHCENRRAERREDIVSFLKQH